jgi:RNA polymerase sigma-70 factor, ECF subfamily
VLLLHEVFGVAHAEIAALLQKSEAATRQLLSRARQHVAAERRVFETSSGEHRRLLAAFVRASQSGEVAEMMRLLADDAVLIVDTGPEGRRVGRIRNAGRPIAGARRIAAFLAAVTRERGESGAQGSLAECMLNGQPATVFVKDGRPDAALLISVADGRIRRVFVQADSRRLTHLGVLRAEPRP